MTKENTCVRVAIAGMGFMGRMHLSVYLSKLKNVEVTALFDARKEAMEINNLGSSGNITADSLKIDLSKAVKYTNYDEMLNKGEFDFVDICLPTHLHAETAVKALDKGYHVFCEKPLARTVEEGKRIVDAVKRSGKLFSVGHCLRYWPAYTEVKKLIKSGAFGKVRYAEFERFSNPPVWTTNQWAIKGNISGNAALDLHIHDVDMIQHIFGLPYGVVSRGVKENDGSISHITTLYNYKNLVVNATGGWICSDSYAFNMRAFFILEEATIELDFSKEPVVMVYPKGKNKYPLELPQGDGYYYELKNFVEGVKNGEITNPVSAESALESLRLCLLEIESAKSGKYQRV